MGKIKFLGINMWEICNPIEFDSEEEMWEYIVKRNEERFSESWEAWETLAKKENDNESRLDASTDSS